MNHLPVYSRPFEDDDVEELSLDDEHVELASELREYSEDDFDDEFTEQERRELVIAPLTPPRPPTAPTTLRAKVPSRIELEPPSPPAFALGPGQLPPRPAKVVPPVKKEAAPAQKPSASVKKMAVSAKKVSVAKKTTFAVKAAIAPSAPTQKIASKKVAPAKNAPAKKK